MFANTARRIPFFDNNELSEEAIAFNSRPFSGGRDPHFGTMSLTPYQRLVTPLMDRQEKEIKVMCTRHGREMERCTASQRRRVFEENTKRMKSLLDKHEEELEQVLLILVEIHIAMGGDKETTVKDMREKLIENPH